jgi:hypothetical protein
MMPRYSGGEGVQIKQKKIGIAIYYIFHKRVVGKRQRDGKQKSEGRIYIKPLNWKLF